MKLLAVTRKMLIINFILKEICVATSSLEINIINLTNIQNCSIILILNGRKNVFEQKKRKKSLKSL